MSLKAVFGSTHSTEPREAGSSVARQVVDQPGQEEPILGILFVSAHLGFSQVLNGALTLMGDIPVIGCSVAVGMFEDGLQEHGVQLALLTGEGTTVTVNWQPEFNEDSDTASRSLLSGLGFDGSGTLFICADGFGGNAEQLAKVLPKGSYGLAGILSASDLRMARTYQVAGQQSGFGGIAGAFLQGNLAMGVGQAHGWMPSGAYFNLSGITGPFVTELDQRLPPEAFSSLFGFTAGEWTSPPLDELVRMYPLGIERGQSLPVLVRSPLRMESNGLLRMHSVLPEGEVAHVMVGSADTCMAATVEATQQALAQLNGAQPVLGLVLVDVAWRQLLQARAGMELQMVRKTLTDAGIATESLPLMGAYVYGQYGHGPTGAPEFFNQHIQVILFGSQD